MKLNTIKQGWQVSQGKKAAVNFFPQEYGNLGGLSVQRRFPLLILSFFFPLKTSVNISHSPTDVAKQVPYFVLKKNDISSIGCPTSVTESSLLLLHNLHILSYIP